jgi:large conductance mechanosensitive channel
MKTLLKEFKDFAVKGNVVDMAVGVIVGGAFGKIVTSLVNDVIMPLVGVLTGGIDFSNLFLPLDGNTYTLAEAETAGAAVLKYGSFLSQVLDFLIVSFVIFIFVKKIMALGRKKEAPVEEAPKTKVCPYCKSEIAIDATRCPHCTSELP